MTPQQIAAVIFTAATDNTTTLRYRAGTDAEQLLTARASMSDSEFVGMMKAQLHLK